MPYCANRDCAAALCAWRLLRVPVPDIPAAAYLASMFPPGRAGRLPGSYTGVSGGGGEPRLARVVELEAVDAKRLTLFWLSDVLLELLDAPPGGG